ncbi:hypothetical protein [Pseudomonas sp. TE3610]
MAVSEDLKIAHEIFSLIEAGIVNGYDSFRYEVEVAEGYTEETLRVEINGGSFYDAETDFNGAILYRLVRTLHRNFVARGEGWRSFTMTYVRGGEVKTSFNH